MKNNLPDKDGFFGEYGGKFVPETLMYALNELEQTYKTLKDNNDFNAEFHKDLAEFVGRPSPFILCKKAHRALQHCFNLVKKGRFKSYRSSQNK